MLLIVSVLFATAFASPACTTYTGCAVHGHDMAGGMQYTDPQSCEAGCLAAPECKYFVFRTNKNVCGFKSSGPIVNKPGRAAICGACIGVLTKAPTIAPTATNAIKATIPFTGDYSTVLTYKALFLKECSNALRAQCVDVRPGSTPGSIEVDIQGKQVQVDASLAAVQNGLDLPSFPKLSPPIQATIPLDGDYSTVVTDKAQFLKECSNALPAKCVDVRPGSTPGSIEVDVEGTQVQVDASLAAVRQNGGLDLPSFPKLTTPIVLPACKAAPVFSPTVGATRCMNSIKVPAARTQLDCACACKELGFNMMFWKLDQGTCHCPTVNVCTVYAVDPSWQEFNFESLVDETVLLNGDYSTVVTDKAQFLKECSNALPAKCVDVRPGSTPGSIEVDIEGTQVQVDASLAAVRQNGGLDLPSFPMLTTHAIQENTDEIKANTADIKALADLLGSPYPPVPTPSNTPDSSCLESGYAYASVSRTVDPEWTCNTAGKSYSLNDCTVLFTITAGSKLYAQQHCRRASDTLGCNAISVKDPLKVWAQNVFYEIDLLACTPQTMPIDDNADIQTCHVGDWAVNYDMVGKSCAACREIRGTDCTLCGSGASCCAQPGNPARPIGLFGEVAYNTKCADPSTEKSLTNLVVTVDHCAALTFLDPDCTTKEFTWLINNYPGADFTYGFCECHTGTGCQKVIANANDPANGHRLYLAIGADESTSHTTYKNANWGCVEPYWYALPGTGVEVKPVGQFCDSGLGMNFDECIIAAPKLGLTLGTGNDYTNEGCYLDTDGFVHWNDASSSPPDPTSSHRSICKIASPATTESLCIASCQVEPACRVAVWDRDTGKCERFRTCHLILQSASSGSGEGGPNTTWWQKTNEADACTAANEPVDATEPTCVLIHPLPEEVKETATSVEECQLKCFEDATCTNINYDTATNECAKFPGIINKIPTGNPNQIAGPQNCYPKAFNCSQRKSRKCPDDWEAMVGDNDKYQMYYLAQTVTSAGVDFRLGKTAKYMCYNSTELRGQTMDNYNNYFQKEGELQACGRCFHMLRKPDGLYLAHTRDRPANDSEFWRLFHEFSAYSPQCPVQFVDPSLSLLTFETKDIYMLFPCTGHQIFSMYWSECDTFRIDDF